MANILFRGTVAPIQPGLVAGGSAAKNSPLTLEEGDWNYKALNDDIQTRAPIDAPSFTGVVSVNYNIRSVLAKYNKYVAGFAGSIASCKIGEYLPNANALNATLIVEVVGRTHTHLAHAKAMVMYRSETLPATLITITNDKYRNNTTDLTIEAYVDNTTGKLVLFANTTGTLTNVSFNVDVYERSADNLFTLNTGYVAKNTTGLTQIVESPSVPEDIQSLLDTKVSKSGDVMTGNLTAPIFIGALNGNATTATTLQTARTINGVSFSGSGNITVTANTPSSVIFNTSGTGDATGATFNGSAGRTISYNTIGAPSATGSGASGTWGISITGSSAKTKAVGLIQSDVSSSIAVVAGNHYNVINPGITLTLPPNPAVDDTIYFTATVSNWTVACNGKYIMGLLEDMLFDATQKITFGLKFVRDNSTNGWMLI